MAKTIGKYFLAVVPRGKIQEEATEIKLAFKENFNVKYALKSPAHVTVKMPFNYNEAKEGELIQKFEDFFKAFTPFPLSFKNIDRFGRRVIFIHVKSSSQLNQLQLELGNFAKTKLNQVVELSDKNFHPHMTIAFKDMKSTKFDDYWDFAKKLKFEYTVQVDNVSLLKRTEGRWEVIHNFELQNLPT